MPKIRRAFRSLLKTPVVTLVVILSLGLGIGASTAIFSLMHQILLQRLPVPEPERLALITSPGEFKGGRQSTNEAGDMDYVFSYRAFRRLEASDQDAADVAAFRMWGANIASGTSTESGQLLLVSGGYFPALRLQPRLGRLISLQDDVPGQGNPVAVLGWGYWQDELGGDPQILNSTIKVNGHPFTVVGITPQGFTGLTLGSDPDVYVPLDFKPLMTPGWDGTDRYDDYWLYLIARLTPGSTLERAQTALNTTYAGFVEEQAETVTGRGQDYIDRFLASRLILEEGEQGHSSFREGSQVPLYILMAATVLVLLIAMANAANLLLARAAQRGKELSIRAALGAGRRHIVGQLLTESLLLSLLAGLTGVLISWWTVSLLIRWIGGGSMAVPFLTARLPWPVLFFALAVSAAAGILIGLYPAWEASRKDVAGALREDTAKSSASRGAAKLRKGLVVAQVTISVLLLVPTGLFLKSLANLVQADLGMDTRGLVTFRVSPDLNGYTPEETRRLYIRMEEELAALPGVSSVTSSMVPLISGSNWGNSITVQGHPSDFEMDTLSNFTEVGPGFLSKMGIPLLRGRDLTEQDTEDGPLVVVVDEAFAEHFFDEGEEVVGKRIGRGVGDGVELDIEIVGLAKQAAYSSVRTDMPRRVFYMPWRQDPNVGGMSFYVRSELPIDRTIPAVRSTMSRIDPDLPLEDLQPMEATVRDNIQADRIVLQLASLFAFLATGLAMLGLYGVMAYRVAQRVREIGIRMALGAAAGRIRMMVMRELMAILGIGLLLGVPAALALARLTESQLFGVQAWDPGVVVSAIAALTAASAAAGFIPAHRAARVDPVKSLRHE
ncbi:MAG: ABC transporter permease [bacterium]